MLNEFEDINPEVNIFEVEIIGDYVENFHQFTAEQVRVLKEADLIWINETVALNSVSK